MADLLVLGIFYGVLAGIAAIAEQRLALSAISFDDQVNMRLCRFMKWIIGGMSVALFAIYIFS